MLRRPHAWTLLIALALAGCVGPAKLIDSSSDDSRTDIAATTRDPADPVAAASPEPREHEPQPLPGAPALLYAPVPVGHQRLHSVSQVPPDLVEGAWILSQFRPVLIGEDQTGCVMLDIESGRVISRANTESGLACDQQLDANAGDRWPDGSSRLHPDYASFDEALFAEFSGQGLEIRDSQQATLQRLDCGGCEYARTSWSPDDHRVAALVHEPPRLDIWDADTGTRLAQLALAVPDLLFETELRWNQRGVVVLVEHGTDDDAPNNHVDISAWFWPARGGALRRRLRLLPDASLPAPAVDVTLEWAMVYSETRGPGDRTHRRLRAVALSDLDSKLDWRSSAGYYDDLHEQVRGRWRSDATTQWLEHRVVYDPHSARTDLELDYRALVVEPRPVFLADRLHHAERLRRDHAAPRLELLGVDADQPLLDWAVDEWDPRSPGAPLPLGDCVARDAAPDFQLLLADCPAPTLVDRQGRVHMPLGVGRDATFQWGRGGWLAAHERGGHFVLVDPASKSIRLEREDIEGIAPVALASTLDRIALRFADRIELIDAQTGATVRELPRFLGRAALHPDGERLAYIHRGRAHVIDLGSGDELASWAEPEFPDLAWRQDGAALLVGRDTPKRVVDPSDGHVLATLDRWPRFEADHLDPSWRWAALPDGRILRTIDGMTMEFGSGWARLDCGLYEGPPASSRGPLAHYLYRASEDPYAVPTLTGVALDRWLARPGVVAAFFAGEVIEPPSIPDAGGVYPY